MKIHDMFRSGKPVLSFEIFPPKRDGDVSSVIRTIDELAVLKPNYISVTYGAAGSERGLDTVRMASKIKNEYHIEALAHLTSVGASEDDIKRILSTYKEQNIENILALRGDLDPNTVLQSRDFKYASDLVAFIKREGDFDIAAACYPESHVEARSKTTDLIYLKDKVQNGVDFLVTQLFFDNEQFYSFRNEVRSLDINIPITVGIMPVLNRKQIERMVALSGATLPEKFKKILVKYEDKPSALQDAGIAYACEQIVDLLSSGVDGIHLYVMNKPEIAQRIVQNISGILNTMK
ncbi:methylenetetrahydrofolate reductase [NAD(P)H] [Fusibacter bizertensis]|uniref:Methylenetetrahydrofolate reductase n=1 Tax=Fusibacter bizertensis TaxID=1488331 RepID=A0ABT6N9R4_9FIRM|nr:methylenetetrahydrofolate reductase [NAD(P)H] [Fusibacter bizertensis]MDH8677150.1 methylenetetrahydrofolate reductase [NAD(P)H] [Fusibacter bizertensis]